MPTITQTFSNDHRKTCRGFFKLSKYVDDVELTLAEIGSNDFDELMAMSKKDRRYGEMLEVDLQAGAIKALKQMLKGLDGRLVKPFDFQLFLMGHRMELQWIGIPILMG